MTARAHRPAAGRARPVREPRQGAGRDRGRAGDRRRRGAAQARPTRSQPTRCSTPRRSIHGCRAAASSSSPRSIISASIRPGASASMSARRPAASPTCCCARGARRVYAVDVGRGQLHPQLRGDPAVVSLEQTDIRALDPRSAEPPDFAVIDVSFISLKLVLPAAIVACSRRPAQLVALIKPQFEAGRGHVKKGIVRDAADPCGGVRRHRGVHRVARLGRDRRDAFADRGRGGQQGVSDRARAPRDSSRGEWTPHKIVTFSRHAPTMVRAMTMPGATIDDPQASRLRTARFGAAR